jgi:hypothetical protein
MDVAIWAVLATALVGVARALPSIIWAIRCPPNSPNYKHPPMPRMFSGTRRPH